jgi:hypothetical protein
MLTPFIRLQRGRGKTMMGRAAAFAGIALAVGLFPRILSADTNFDGNTISGFGVDDINYVTLSPYLAQYVTYCPWVASAAAAAGSPFSNWTFNFAQNVSLPNVPSADLDVDLYAPWVVTNDPVSDPGGTQRARPVDGADAGGADFSLIYYPSGTDPTTNISFIQALSITTTINTGTETNPVLQTSTYYRFDTSSNTNPSYNGVSGTLGGSDPWMFDIPYRCENSGTPSAPGLNAGSSPTCSGGTDGTLLSVNWQAQVFVAQVNTVTKTATLYGGEWWGFQYSNVDTPEPALSVVISFALLGFAGVKRYRYRKG